MGILRNDIEYIVHCDSKGNSIGPISKKHAHLPSVRPILTHYSTWSMVFHPESGKYGLQRKNPKKFDKMSAGKWDMGVAGHNCYVKNRGCFGPLSFEKNLIKEAEEEIGLNLKMFKTRNAFLTASKRKNKNAIGFIFDRFHYKTSENNEWVGLGFILVPTMNVVFNDNEVVEFKWFKPNQLKQFLAQNKNYCSPLSLVFEKAEKFRKKYLKI